MNKLKTFLILIVLVALPALADAAIYYVTSAGAGSRNGTNWSNAYQGIPASPARGSTYVVAGGTYSSSVAFNAIASGSTYIYIRKATASAYSGGMVGDTGRDDLIAGWSASYETTQAVWTGQWTFSTNYWHINGVTPQVARSSNKNLYGIKLNPSSSGAIEQVYGTSPSYVTFKNVAISGGPCYQGFSGAGSDATSYWTFSYCFFDTLMQAAKLDIGHYFTFEYTYFSPNVNSTYAAAYCGGGHGETIAFNATSYHVFKYNWFENVGNNSGGLMRLCSGAESLQSNNVEIYGNIFSNCTGEANNGLIGTADSGLQCISRNWKVLNNTFVNSGNVGFSFSPNANTNNSGWQIRNNLFYNSSAGYFNTNKPADCIYSNNYHNGGTYSLTAGTGDVTSSESLAVLFPNYASQNYTPGVSSQSRNMGVTLGSPYNIDIIGNTRGADGTWDAGAYEYTSGDTTPPTVTITSPTSETTYTASSTPLSMGGTASDNVAVTSVSYANSAGGSGSCTGTTSWTCSVPLSYGSNVVTVSASDAVSNVGTDVLTVTYPQQITVSTSFNAVQGSISPTSRLVTSGNTTTFTVTANTGYQISTVTGCSGSLAGATYTTGTITAACTVTATFVAVDITPPVISGAYPSAEQKCSVRRVPLTIGITTDENATCRYSTMNIAYDSMSLTFSGAGTTSHSVSITPTCGITHLYYVHCRDTAGNATSTPGTITFTVTPQYWRRGHNVDIR